MNIPSDKKHILVTGSHRSGSTWVGEVLSSSRQISYVHEPFNIDLHQSSPLQYWFEYISSESSETYQIRVAHSIQNHLQANYQKLFPSYKSNGFRGALATIKEVGSSIQANKRVIKAPIAFMSAEWLNENFCKYVIITIRHPAAFAASLKVKNWTFDFNHFVQQEELMQKYLEPYRQQITVFAHNPPDIIQQACLLWNCIHHIVINYKSKFPEWLFVRHEDLSSNPINEFSKVFNHINVPFSKKVRNYIKQSTQIVKSSGQNLPAKANIKNWKNRLFSEEIDIIYKTTKHIADEFYSSEEW